MGTTDSELLRHSPSAAAIGRLLILMKPIFMNSYDA